jgi:hypothetical protein
MSNDAVIGNLGDIPDLSGVGDEQSSGAFVDGWYEGRIQAKREFTDKNGNDRLFESGDTPSANGESRNIRLQVELTRASDGRTLNTSTLINYQPTDLTAETVAAIAAQKEKNKESGERQWGPLFRSFMSLTRLGKLQKIAGVRQLQRNGDGGLDLTPVYGKTAYFKLGEDDRNPQYKAIVDFRETKPTKVPVL